jgi:glycosyltransferase involved in cell wall biosynthesis
MTDLLRLSMVSTYPPMSCGIGVYSQKLLRAVAAVGPGVEATVIGEGTDVASSEPGIAVRSVYGRREDYREKILRAAAEDRAQVVHFQHAPDLFGCDARLPSLLRELGGRGVRTVVTLHTIYEDSLLKKLAPGMAPGEFHRALGSAADLLIVHHRDGMADRLVAQGVPEGKIRVIPHGTDLVPPRDPVESRRALGLPERGVYFTFFGFIHVQKNVHTALAAFAHIARRAEDAHLLIAGKPFRDRPHNRAYLALMKARCALSGLEARVHVRDGYVPAELVPAVFGASDVLLLPHRQSYGSASGVFHQAIGARKPIIVARGPKFEDGLKRLAAFPALTPPPTSVPRWAEAMLALYRDAELRESARSILSEYAAETAWSNIAASTREAYLGLLGT